MSMLELAKGISSSKHNDFTVIAGKPGSGKTTLAGTYPKPLLYVAIDTDGGGEVLKNYDDKDVKVIELSSDKVGEQGAKHIQTKVMALLEELITTKHPYKTVVIDAYSSIEEGLVIYLEQQKGKKLSIDERGVVGNLMTKLRDKVVALSLTGVSVVVVTHIKNMETTDNTTGEKSIMIVPKMSYNNGNILLERASNVMYCCRKTIINPDGTRRVGFLTYIGAHPNIDTKLRLSNDCTLTKGTYIEDLTYEKLQEVIKGGSKKVEKLEKINVVESQENPFNEETKKDEGEDW